MCKFNANLFIITVWCSVWIMLIGTNRASPIDFMLLDEFIDEPAASDHDLTYDQRQNGTENIRLNIDGVIIAVPSSSSSQASSAIGNVAANYLLQLAAGADDDSDDGDYFPFVKNANNENGVTAPSSSSVNDKEASEYVKDDKISKKKNTFKAEPTKENNVKRVVIVKEDVRDESPDVIPQRINPVAPVQEQSKFEVIPVKKVQSRRKNK